MMCNVNGVPIATTNKSTFVVFLHDRPWISPWIKWIFKELDITYDVTASKLTRYCDVISNRFDVISITKTERFRHGTTCKDRRLCHSSAIMSLECYCCVFCVNKHKNNPLVSAETVHHSSTYIILSIYTEGSLYSTASAVYRAVCSQNDRA